MTQNNQVVSRNENKTAQAFVWTNLLRAPFWGIYALLIFILKKEFNDYYAISALIALRPALSLFSPYWSALVHNRPDRLRSNIILASIIAHLPFFFFPFINNAWFLVISGALFLTMKRGIIPAWMELLKRNLPEKRRNNTFSYGNTLSYLGGAILPIFFGLWMDKDLSAWRIIFPITSLLSLAGTFFMLRIPNIEKNSVEKKTFSLTASILKPWRDSWNLLKERKDFLFFQVGFMLGGSGLMIMQPAIPGFFDDILHLSYTAIAIAVATCKGIGFAVTSRIWSGAIKAANVYRLSAYTTVLAALFPICLIFGQAHEYWVYFSYIIYGVMQAGSELCWHVSGPIFSHKEDSSTYSAVNVFTVGIRGVFAPFLGSMLLAQMSPMGGLLVGGVICAIGAVQLLAAQKQFGEKLSKEAA